MSSLLKKSFRDLWIARWQAIGIALLVAIVTSMVVGGIHTHTMLDCTITEWSERLRMADLEVLFSPTHPGVTERVEGIEGIVATEERLIAEGVLSGEGLRPIPALLRVLPEEPPKLNRLELLSGRYPEPGEKAVVIDRSLRAEHGIDVGDTVTLEVGDQVKQLPVIGVSLSPEHLLHPVHPEYTLPLRGTVAVVGVSVAATEDVEHANRINSILIKYADGVDRVVIQREILAALPVAPSQVKPLERQPSRVFSTMIIRTFEIYMPSVTLVCVTIAIVLLVLTHMRLVRRQEKTIGTLLSLGYTPRAVSMSFIAMATVPTLIGSAIGAWSEGYFASSLFDGYADSVGYAPKCDPGAGDELPLTIAACLAVSVLACVLPGFQFSRARPAALLRPVQSRRSRRLPGPAMRVAAMLRDVLHLPISVVLGLTNVVRRRWSTLAAVLGLGGIFALVLSFLIVHVTHRVGLEASVARMGLDATVIFKDAVGPEEIEETARLAEGTAEPIISRLAMLDAGKGSTYRRLICAPPGGWVNKLLVREGRRFTEPWANEILIDRWIADEEGLALGDHVDAYPFANAPEGVTLEVVGFVEGVSLGTAVIPLETGRSLFGMYDAATGAHITSALDQDALETALWKVPGVESVFGMERALARVEANFKGSELVLTLSLFMAIGIAVIFLGILAALDAADRAPDLAVLQALGWRDRALLGLCLTEVMARGVAALAIALPLAPFIATWLMRRIGEANHYQMELIQPVWLGVAVAGAALALLPLGALPAMRAAKRVTPGRAMRLLSRE